jgi:hypothetical protein
MPGAFAGHRGWRPGRFWLGQGYELFHPAENKELERRVNDLAKVEKEDRPRVPRTGFEGLRFPHKI